MRKLGVLVVAACMSSSGGIATADSGYVVPCTHLAVSPAFSSDRTAFCAGEVISGDRTVTGVAVHRTTDGGRTWTSARAAGVPTPTSPGGLLEIFVSPRFRSDGALVLQMRDAGLLVSLDSGDTFLPVDPLGGYGRVTFVTHSVTPPTGGPAVDTAWLAFAQRGASDGVNNSVLIDPTTRLRTAVRGTPGRDIAFLAPVDGSGAGDMIALAETGVGESLRNVLYRCDAVLTCATRLFQFPPRHIVTKVWFTPDFATSRVAFARTFDPERGAALWRSSDGGKSFVRWVSAERLMGGFSLPPEVVVAGGKPGSRTVYLRVTRPEVGAAVPAEQLWSSGDRGLTWRLVSFGRLAAQRGSRGVMPVHPPSVSDNLGALPRGTLSVTPSGAILSLGVAVQAPGRPSTIFCTTNNGRSWSTRCT